MLQIKSDCNCFLVNNSFVDKYMCEANGSFIKVYLYLLRHSANHNLEIADIANALNILESDVIRAFKYWQKQNVIKYRQINDKDYIITFIDNESTIPAETVEEKNVSKPQTMPTAVSYTKNDINTYMKNNDGIRHMFLISEQLLCKTLTDTDMKILFSFYDYLALPVEVIFTLLEYCISLGKTNMRYIEKVAYSWADRGINTLAKASSHVKEENELNSTYKRFKTMFKITGREFTATEEAYIKEWVYTMKLSDKVINDAYEKTIANTGKIAFKYMDAILKNSSQTPADNINKAHKQQNFEKKNFFQDYDDDISEFELQLMHERLNRK